jgi:hypothetical protein
MPFLLSSLLRKLLSLKDQQQTLHLIGAQSDDQGNAE